MIGAIFRTVDSWGPAFLRVTLGGVMFIHGAQKALGWFGGNGWEGTMKYFVQTMHIPEVLAMAAILTEVAGSLFLILGFLTRFWAAGIGILISVAAWKVHWQHGFFMNWFGNQKGEGYEYHLLILGMSLALICTGAGRMSIDKLIGGTAQGAGGGGAPKAEKKAGKVKLK